MKLLTILILVGLIPFFAKSQNCFYQIDFQEAFDGDTVSFFIDGMPLFENQILTTLKHRGRTDLKILPINNGKDYIVGLVPIIRNFYQIKYSIKLKSDKISIKMVLKGLTYHKNIDLLEGNYIGISTYDIDGDWDKKGLFIAQQFYPFAYD